MKKMMAVGMALALGLSACAGPKLTPLDADIAIAQSNAATACYQAESAKATARQTMHYVDARDAALVIMAEALAGRNQADPCARQGMNVYESRVRIAEAQNQTAASVTKSVISGAALVTGIVATADVLNTALKNAGHNNTTTVGDNSEVKLDSSSHDTRSESRAWGDNSPANATAEPSTTRDNVTTTTTNHAPPAEEAGAATAAAAETATTTAAPAE